MFARMMCAAGTLALLCGGLEAQDGLHSAAFPEPTLSSAVAGERDLFRVPPDFYNRRPDSDGSQLFFPELRHLQDEGRYTNTCPFVSVAKRSVTGPSRYTPLSALIAYSNDPV